MGIALGIIFLNVGVMMWLISKLNGNRNADRLSGDIIKASIMLVAVAFLVYVW